MVAHTITIDETGHITLSSEMLDALGVHAATEVIVELTEAGLIIKPKYSDTPITERIAAMDLPVADWEKMEQEIESGNAE